MSTTQGDPSGKNRGVATTFVAIFVVSLLLILVGRKLLYSTPSCQHTSTFTNWLQFDDQILVKSLTGAKKALYQLGINHRLCGMVVADIETLLTQAEHKSATEHGAEFVFSLPQKASGIQSGTPIWLSVEVDYRCGHVVKSGIFAEPRF